MTPDKERRRYDRYDTEVKIYFQVTYDIETKVKYQIIDKQEGGLSSDKYPALSKNVSPEGLCFVSDKQLKEGTFLHLEVYLPTEEKPIHMEGEARWSRESGQPNKFDTGVRPETVNGKPVAESIHIDKENQIAWSVVLDSVFGNFSAITKKKKRQI